MEEQEGDDESGGGGGGGFRVELVHSYLAFAKRALRTRWRTSVIALLVGVCLTVLAVKYLPRTYSCTTIMMVQGTHVLDARDAGNPLAGAEDIIKRKENLEWLVRDTGLVKTAAGRRPPLLHLKDRLIELIFGEMDDRTRALVLVGTLESKLSVSVEKGDLTIKVDWSDPVTCAELAEAARQSFLKARHQAEVSAFEDKMTILDGHASQLRDDIGVLVQQLKVAREQQLAKGAEARKATAAAATTPSDAAAAPVARPIARRSPGSDPQIPVLTEKLTALKAKLTALDADRARRVSEEQAKYDELKLRLTTSHPSVVLQKERIAVASQVPSDEVLLQSEVKNISAEIQQREAVLRQNGDSVLGGGSGGGRRANEALPVEVTEFLERDNLDPALSAQLSGAVMTYGSLRNELFTTRVDLDTAQAAFQHRYQVIVPAEAPRKAAKPKIPVVFGGGLFLSLLLALVLPIVAELRVDIIRERWQVEHIALPVLAELRLPPHSSD
ncbi:MAG TPA: hypothetical protein VFK05_25985 [Polyangiaceae bacterium]|nr:hypothetical protein [Polyangiaceae bacterium]